jgi:hypothetical protein
VVLLSSVELTPERLAALEAWGAAQVWEKRQGPEDLARRLDQLVERHRANEP